MRVSFTISSFYDYEDASDYTQGLENNKNDKPFLQVSHQISPKFPLVFRYSGVVEDSWTS